MNLWKQACVCVALTFWICVILGGCFVVNVAAPDNGDVAPEAGTGQARQGGARPSAVADSTKSNGASAKSNAVGSKVQKEPTPHTGTTMLRYDGHTYALYTVQDLPSGVSAEKYCEELGGHLATLASDDENWTVAYWVAQNGFSNAFFGMVYDSDRQPNRYWVNGEPVAYEAWWNGEYTFGQGDEPVKGVQEYAIFCHVDTFGELDGHVTGDYHVEADRTYEPALAFDRDLTTAWVEGAAGNGEGESIRFNFDEEYGFLDVSIASGYQKREDLFYRNGRPASIRLDFKGDNGDKSFAFAVQDEMGYQTFELPQLVLADEVIITIESVYPGSEFEDTAISDVEFGAILVDPAWMTDNGMTEVFICEWDTDVAPGAASTQAPKGAGDERAKQAATMISQAAGTPAPKATAATAPDTEAPDDAGTLDYAQIPHEYGTSGANWGTILTIDDSGEFEGRAESSWHADAGEEYPNGTAEYCDFSGSLGTLVQVNEYEYRAPVVELHVVPASEAETYIKDGRRYVGDDTPLGMEDAQELVLYIPGCAVSDIPEECYQWLRMVPESLSHIDYYVLANSSNSVAFRSLSTEGAA